MYTRYWPRHDWKDKLRDAIFSLKGSASYILEETKNTEEWKEQEVKAKNH